MCSHENHGINSLRTSGCYVVVKRFTHTWSLYVIKPLGRTIEVFILVWSYYEASIIHFLSLSLGIAINLTEWELFLDITPIVIYNYRTDYLNIYQLRHFQTYFFLPLIVRMEEYVVLPYQILLWYARSSKTSTCRRLVRLFSMFVYFININKWTSSHSWTRPAVNKTVYQQG